mmetsp:Transcript_28998/g.63851  ORF Transcript_28998/g.63851 Transcript_28998/m.63851 type:complete len:220 (+) Transcript_28998:230-889(+)
MTRLAKRRIDLPQSGTSHVHQRDTANHTPNPANMNPQDPHCQQTQHRLRHARPVQRPPQPRSNPLDPGSTVQVVPVVLEEFPGRNQVIEGEVGEFVKRSGRRQAPTLQALPRPPLHEFPLQAQSSHILSGLLELVPGLHVPPPTHDLLFVIQGCYGHDHRPDLRVAPNIAVHQRQSHNGIRVWDLEHEILVPLRIRRAPDDLGEAHAGRRQALGFAVRV